MKSLLRSNRPNRAFFSSTILLPVKRIFGNCIENLLSHWSPLYMKIITPRVHRFTESYFIRSHIKRFFFFRFFSKWRRRRRTQYGYYWWIVLILVAFLKILWTNVKNLISRLIVKFQRGWSLFKSYWSEKSGLLNYKYILHNSFCCSNFILLWWEIWSFNFFSLV